MLPVFDVEPRINGEVRIGSGRGENLIYAGRLAEKNNSSKLIFDGSENFIVLEVGKRGSGKSYGMASMLEGFAVARDSQIGTHQNMRAVLLLDPLDIHWTAIEPLRADGPEGLAKQYKQFKKWENLEVEPINVRVFVPAGFQQPTDPSVFRPYELPVAALDAADWAFLLNCDLVNEPRGQLLDELHRKVTSLGWRKRGASMPAKRDYTVNDLVECAENDEEIERLYQSGTVRSVIQPLRSYARMALFGSATGTPLTELISSGVLSVLSLGRLPAALRTVLTTVIVRKLRYDRMQASQIQRRLTLINNDSVTRTELQAQLLNHVPRTILAIDEAQILMPAKASSAARRELDAYVLEGRNYGLSLWMATQRPKGAVSGAAVSQIDCFIVHRLSVRDDIDAVCGMLQNAQPERVKLNGRGIELPQMIRSLGTGQAIFSAAVNSAPRLVVGTIRPRMVAHGGESF
jgi:hypothetical protein